MLIELLWLMVAGRALAADELRAAHPCPRRDSGGAAREARRGPLPVLLALDRRHERLESLANSSHLLHAQSIPWMEKVNNKYPMDRSKLSYAHKSSLFSSPLRMFMTTIVVPSVTFIAVFIYVIFYTGSSDEIPYKSITLKESATSVKCS